MSDRFGLIGQPFNEALGPFPSLVRFERNTQGNGRLAGEQVYFSAKICDDLIKMGLCTRIASFKHELNTYKCVWMADEVKHWTKD